MLPTLDLAQKQRHDTANEELAEYLPVRQVEGRDSLEANTHIPPHSFAKQAPDKGWRPTGTPAQVTVVAGLLVSKDSTSYFLDNCRLTYEGWMSPFSAQPLACNNDVEQFLIAALDLVQDLLKGNRIRRILLWLECMHLARPIVD